MSDYKTYSASKDKHHPVAEALREAGYSPLPRWWVTREQLHEIREIAMTNESEVVRIRRSVT